MAAILTLQETFLPEVIAEVDHNRKMTHNQRCISVFVSML